MRSTLPLSLWLCACGAVEPGPSATPPVATVIATGNLPAQAIAVDASNVYWTTGAADATPHPTVLQCSKIGCAAPTVLESGTETRQWIAVDTTAVDWITSEGTAVARCAIGGCGVSPDTVPYVNVWDIAVATPGAVWNAGSYVIDQT